VPWVCDCQFGIFNKGFWFWDLGDWDSHFFWIFDAKSMKHKIPTTKKYMKKILLTLAAQAFYFLPSPY
jgi:hypothetical protein